MNHIATDTDLGKEFNYATSTMGHLGFRLAYDLNRSTSQSKSDESYFNLFTRNAQHK